MTSQEAPSLQVQINLGAFVASSDAVVLETIHMVSFGLGASFSEEPPSLPGAQIHLMWREAPDLNASKDIFSSWLVGVGLRRFIEAFHELIGRACFIASIVHRAKNPGYAFDFDAEMTRINRRNLPDKFKHFQQNLETELAVDAVEDVLSINQARNCYEHRRGVVSKLDTTNPEGDKLVVRWSTLMLSVKREDGRVELLENPIGSVIEGPATVLMGWKPRQKVFPIGSRLEFSPREFGEIGTCFMRMGRLLSESLGHSIASSSLPESPGSGAPEFAS